MRDSARIERMIGKLLRAWSAAPYLRFGQLLINAKIGQSFYEEDDITEAKIEEWIKNPPKTIKSK